MITVQNWNLKDYLPQKVLVNSDSKRFYDNVKRIVKRDYLSKFQYPIKNFLRSGDILRERISWEGLRDTGCLTEDEAEEFDPWVSVLCYSYKDFIISLMKTDELFTIGVEKTSIYKAIPCPELWHQKFPHAGKYLVYDCSRGVGTEDAWEYFAATCIGAVYKYFALADKKRKREDTHPIREDYSDMHAVLFYYLSQGWSNMSKHTASFNLLQNF